MTDQHPTQKSTCASNAPSGTCKPCSKSRQAQICTEAKLSCVKAIVTFALLRRCPIFGHVHKNGLLPIIGVWFSCSDKAAHEADKPSLKLA